MLSGDFHFLRGADWGSFTAAAAAAGEPQLYQPAPFTAKGEEVAGRFDFGVIGRLRSGAGVAGAKAELDRLTAGLLATDPSAGIQVVTALTPLRDQFIGAMGARLWLLLAAVLVVLLLVALNLANLMLVRAQTRAPEAALRQALGASRSQVARGWLVEAGLLAAAGGGLGMLLAVAGLRSVSAASLALTRVAALPRAQAVRLDGATVFFAAAAALLAALVCAAPVVRLLAQVHPASGLDLASPRLAGGGARARSWMVAGESALTAVLLILTGLLLHSFLRLNQIAPGYDAGPKLIVAADLAGPPGPRGALWQALPSRLEALPGVARAALTTELPLQGTGVTSPVLVPGDSRPVAQQPIANYQYVSPGYFATLGIAVRGREFTAGDLRPGAPPVAVISATTAARVWPGGDALGQVFRAAAEPPTTVVGIASDVRTELRRAPGPMVFEPSTQDLRRHLAWIVVRPRAGADLGALAVWVRAAIHELQPEAVITRSETMQDIRAAAVAPQRFQLSLAAGFGALALLIAGLGVYGVVSYTVESHRGELGVRLALGASRSDVAAWTVRRGLAPVLAGLAAGVAAALL
ncbi:MAG: FtsX-like permease family protein, partial [Terriglobales bacterium]